MEPTVEELRRVLETYPWLIQPLRDAEWSPLPDGGMGFETRLPDCHDLHEGVQAFAEAFGLDPPEIPPDYGGDRFGE